MGSSASLGWSLTFLALHVDQQRQRVAHCDWPVDRFVCGRNRMLEFSYSIGRARRKRRKCSPILGPIPCPSSTSIWH